MVAAIGYRLPSQIFPFTEHWKELDSSDVSFVVSSSIPPPFFSAWSLQPEKLWSLEPCTGTETCPASRGEKGQRATDGEGA